MRKTAQLATNAFLAVVLITLAAPAGFSKSAWAASGNVQVCQQNSTCTVGEFLYDDSYVPVTSASCSFSSKYPNGDVFVNSQPMTPAAQNDGWYSYDVVATGSAGVYRSAVCCTNGAERLCLDKSFEVASASAGGSGLTKADVADSVWNAQKSSYSVSGSFGGALQNIVPSASEIAYETWNYSNRSLSTFGSLASDIWAHSTRSLTGFGSLASDIWGISTRTLTGADLSSGSLATKSDVDGISVSSSTITNVQNVTNEVNNISNTVNETRNLLEQVVNKPIIETSTASDVSPSFGAKIQSSESNATQLFVDTQSISSKVGLMVLQWDKLDQNDLLDTLETVTKKIGGENDTPVAKSLFGKIRYFSDSWDWELVKTAQSDVTRIRDISVSLQKDVAGGSSSKLTYTKAKALAALLDRLDTTIGSKSSSRSEQSIFGKIKETKALAKVFDDSNKEVRGVLKKWSSYSLSEKQKNIERLSKEVIAINKIPSVRSVLLTQSKPTEKALRNKGYYVLGIIDSNKKLLARKSGTPMINTWLETGSIVFKSLVTNPSTVISQEVALKYYLPEEIKKDNIIELDPELSATYDTEKKQYYISGKFLLSPSETKTVSVRTSDIWTIKPAEIETLRKQAEELSRPLEKTSYFAQGVTIKSDIDVSLDKAVSLTESTTTPEEKIRAYREAQIELDAAKTKIAKLKELASQAGSIGTLFGFVGGVQALAVWGLIIILVAGFVFLALYMKLLMRASAPLVQPVPVVKKTKKQPTVAPTQVHASAKKKHVGKVFAGLVIFGMGVGVMGGVLLGRSSLSPKETKVFASTAQNNAVLGSAVKKDVCEPKETEKKVVEKQLVTVTVPQGSSVNVRSDASRSAAIVTKLTTTATFPKKEVTEGWVEIVIEQKSQEAAPMSGWVSDEFITHTDEANMKNAPTAKKESPDTVSTTVTVTTTPTGFLRVREGPWGAEIAQVHPGDSFPVIAEKEGWVQVTLPDGVSGWVSAEYVIIDAS